MPVDMYYYTESEWNRLGCGPLPPERNILNRQSLYAGPVKVSTGSRVGEWTARESTDVISEKP
jgi:hypothetical protein